MKGVKLTPLQFSSSLVTVALQSRAEIRDNSYLGFSWVALIKLVQT